MSGWKQGNSPRDDHFMSALYLPILYPFYIAAPLISSYRRKVEDYCVRWKKVRRINPSETIFWSYFGFELSNIFNICIFRRMTCTCDKHENLSTSISKWLKRFRWSRLNRLKIPSRVIFWIEPIWLDQMQSVSNRVRFKFVQQSDIGISMKKFGL